MTRKHTPRKPRLVYSNPFVVARNMATALTPAELASITRPLRAAFGLMRRAEARRDDWCILASSLIMASNIERQGVVRGLHEHLHAADRALAAVEARAASAGTWRAPTLYFNEIEAIDTFIDLHIFQIRQLSYGEFKAAYRTTEGQARTRGATVVKWDGVAEVAAC